MKKSSKILNRIAVSVLSFAMMSVNVFADEYSFDMEKAKQTQGGGQTYVSFTRLDNERRDRLKFNPLWITPESTVEVDYVSEGEYDEHPMNLIFQSWVGALVDSTEDKWIQIPPTSFDETHAVWSYDTITSIYGDDFSDVYAIVIEDSGTNSLLVTGITVTNLSVPEDERENVAGGILTVTKTEDIVTETEAIETDESTDDRITDGEVSVTGSVSKETSAKSDNDVTEKIQTEKFVNDDAENSKPSIPIWLILTISGAVFLAVIIIIVIVLKRRNHGWH